MTLLEKAHELGEMIQESPEMQALKAAEAAQESDSEAQELLKAFNLKRMNLVRDMQAEKITREEATKLNSDAFSEMVESSATIKAYVEAKKDFDAVVQQINGIINFYITGQDPNCTHDCSTCGGCH
ncbi:MAG: YlbF family regulator [Clostridia bacterium]|nr:YlbF family regulator [Clostridia bacterium]MBQ8637407.1 YlbF family regulator [Clostridia bacterium]